MNNSHINERRVRKLLGRGGNKSFKVVKVLRQDVVVDDDDFVVGQYYEATISNGSGEVVSVGVTPAHALRRAMEKAIEAAARTNRVAYE